MIRDWIVVILRVFATPVTRHHGVCECPNQYADPGHQCLICHRMIALPDGTIPPPPTPMARYSRFGVDGDERRRQYRELRARKDRDEYMDRTFKAEERIKLLETDLKLFVEWLDVLGYECTCDAEMGQHAEWCYTIVCPALFKRIKSELPPEEPAEMMELEP